MEEEQPQLTGKERRALKAKRKAEARAASGGASGSVASPAAAASPPTKKARVVAPAALRVAAPALQASARMASASGSNAPAQQASASPASASNALASRSAWSALAELDVAHFQRVAARWHMEMLPAGLADVGQAIERQLQPLLLTWSEELGGVVLAYEGMKPRQSAGLINGECPEVIFDVDVSFIVFSPKVGDKLVARVNFAGHDHLSLIVYDLFKANVAQDAIPPHFSPPAAPPAPPGGGWQDTREGGETLEAGDEVVFEVSSIEFGGKVLLISGSLLPDGSGKTGAARIEIEPPFSPRAFSSPRSFGRSPRTGAGGGFGSPKGSASFFQTSSSRGGGAGAEPSPLPRGFGAEFGSRSPKLGPAKAKASPRALNAVNPSRSPPLNGGGSSSADAGERPPAPARHDDARTKRLLDETLKSNFTNESALAAKLGGRAEKGETLSGKEKRQLKAFKKKLANKGSLLAKGAALVGSS